MASKLAKMSDPLNARGMGNNFLTGRPYSKAYKDFAARWSKLPLYKDKKKLREVTRSLLEFQVTVIVSGTGSGKTMIVPKIATKLMMASPDTASKKVVVTTPKIATTLSAAETGAVTLDVILGQEVGYAFRGAGRDGSSDLTRLLYSTDGTLLQQAERDPDFMEFHTVIIDEAHERPVPSDFLIMMVKNALQHESSKLKVVIMSATIDDSIFINYFRNAGCTVNSIHVSGAPNMPVESLWHPVSMKSDYLQEGVFHIADLPPEASVLFFVPTTNDAEEGCKIISQICKRKAVGSLCLPYVCDTFYAKQKEELRKKAIEALSKKSTRHIVFSTNAAESSITIKGLNYVIDSGLEFSSSWDALRNASILKQRFATQAQIRQRMGRVGRTSPGTVIHLYSREKFESLNMYPLPSICNVDIGDRVLQMTERMSLSSVVTLLDDMITPPSDDQVKGAIVFLLYHRLIYLSIDGVYVSYSHEFVNTFLRKQGSWKASVNGSISIRGIVVHHVSTRLKISPWNAMLVMHGFTHFVLKETIVLAAILEIANGDYTTLYVKNKDTSKVVEIPKKYVSNESHHITLLRLYNAYIASRDDMMNILYLKTWDDIHEKAEEMTRIFWMSDVRDYATKFLGCHAKNDHHNKDVERQVKIAVLLSRMFHMFELQQDRTGVTTNVPIQVTVPRESLEGVPRGMTMGVYESFSIGANWSSANIITWISPNDLDLFLHIKELLCMFPVRAH